MKIGIITFQSAINYGAVLQAYAIQKKLQELGVQSEVIDYQCKKINDLYEPLKKAKNLRVLLSNVVWYRRKKKKQELFNEFKNKYLNLTTKKYYTKEQLEETNKYYDKFISGSDQIWRKETTGFDKTYFLDFVTDRKKKYSYAASFGADSISDELKEEYKALLNDYNKISVREKQGEKIVKELTNKKARIDLDPTFLIKKEEWKKIQQIPKEKKRYVILFTIRDSEKIFRFSEKLAKEKDCKLIYISNDRKKKVNAKYTGAISPEEWIGYLNNAEYVVTNSFHGSAFSIILNKNFFLELQPYPATANSRLENIMDMFNLRDREIVDGKNNHIDENINYEIVENKIEQYKNNSIKYLEEIIKGE